MLHHMQNSTSDLRHRCTTVDNKPDGDDTLTFLCVSLLPPPPPQRSSIRFHFPDPLVLLQSSCTVACQWYLISSATPGTCSVPCDETGAQIRG